jgi:hypothetical protein
VDVSGCCRRLDRKARALPPLGGLTVLAAAAALFCGVTTRYGVVASPALAISAAPMARFNSPAAADSVSSEVLVMQQGNYVLQPKRDWATPPDIPGFTLLEDHFAHDVPRLLGVVLAATPRTYNVAVYKNPPPRADR